MLQYSQLPVHGCVFLQHRVMLTGRKCGQMIRCPYCQSTTVGRIGTGQYYCWSCYYEFTVRKQGVQCYRIVEDGSLTEVKDFNL